jgi:hypothetical protein
VGARKICKVEYGGLKGQHKEGREKKRQWSRRGKGRNPEKKVGGQQRRN